MSILDITNRTENWKTAQYFAPLFGANSVRLARRLLGPGTTLEPGDVRLELFWRGVRDYVHMREDRDKQVDAQDFAKRFTNIFPKLRQDVEKEKRFRSLSDLNYTVDTDEAKEGLQSNLTGTEIDVVLDSPKHLFIGEAKHESSLSANGGIVLVHQLIRQYVTARILVDVTQQEKAVVPFIVGNRVEALRKLEQVKFMLKQGWLKDDHILSWDDIGELH